jgi:hypothetical protein
MVRLALIGFFALAFSPFATWAKSEVMFEGYSKISVGDKHVGYTIQRYEFDAKKKQFKSTYFIQTSADAGGINESLVALADDKFQPISYQYTAKVGATIKIIDAKFDKGVMSATIGNGKVSQNLQKKIAPGVFLSTFLGYLMLQKGYEVGKKFSYTAVAEEDAEVYKGEALIKEQARFKDQDVFRILNTFKDAQFVSYVNPKGEVFGTTSPVQKIATELVAQPAEATQGLLLPAPSLKILFQGVPRGNVHSIGATVAPKVVPTEASTAIQPVPKAEPPRKDQTKGP